MQPVIVFDHVAKRYPRYGQPGLRQTLGSLARRFLPGHGSRPSEDEWLWAIRDLSFAVLPGQTVGIIGPNGAGKTTTLKLLSRITWPTQGRIEVSGRVSALIELGAGFHPELTGRENVLLNGTILGMRRQEIAARFDDIVAFADLARFMDTPVKYYSSGMYARLGFAVAAFTNPDVLLVDEVLAVGDYSFQQRCHQRMRQLQAQGTTILLVSHNLQAISEVCDEVVVVSRGEAVYQGPTQAGLAEYSSLSRKAIITKDELGVGQDGIGQRLMTHGAEVIHVQLVGPDGEPARVVAPGTWVRLEATIEFREDAPQPHFSCFVRDEQGRLIYDQTTLWQNTPTPDFVAGQRATVTYDLQMNVVEGTYYLGLDLHYQDLSCYYDRLESAASLVVHGGDGAKGVADLRCRFGFPDALGREPVLAHSREEY